MAETINSKVTPLLQPVSKSILPTRQVPQEIRAIWLNARNSAVARDGNAHVCIHVKKTNAYIREYEARIHTFSTRDWRETMSQNAEIRMWVIDGLHPSPTSTAV